MQKEKIVLALWELGGGVHVPHLVVLWNLMGDKNKHQGVVLS